MFDHEDIVISELTEALAKRNLPECWKAIRVIEALKGKRVVIAAEAPAVEEPAQDPAPADA